MTSFPVWKTSDELRREGKDPSKVNVFGQPIKPKPYLPPQTSEVVVIDEVTPAAEHVDFRPGVGIPFAVTEEVVRHTVHYVWPIVHPTVHFDYRSGPAPLTQPVVHEATEPPRQDRVSVPRETLLWLAVGSAIGAAIGVLIGLAVALVFL